MDQHKNLFRLVQVILKELHKSDRQIFQVYSFKIEPIVAKRSFVLILTLSKIPADVRQS